MRRYVNLIRNAQNWWLHFFHKWHLTATEPIHYRLRNNVSVEVPVRLLHEFKEVFMDECYAPPSPMKLTRDSIIINIGAKAGFFTLFAAARYPGARIYSFEPVPVNFKQLKRNVDSNANHNIRIFQQAVFSHTGDLRLTWDPTDSFTTSATIVDLPEDHLETFNVPCLSLEDLFESHGIQHCDFLKMDCEGAEHPILLECPGDTLRKISRAAIEVHAGPEPTHTLPALAEHLFSQGLDTTIKGNILHASRRSGLD